MNMTEHYLMVSPDRKIITGDTKGVEPSNLQTDFFRYLGGKMFSA